MKSSDILSAQTLQNEVLLKPGKTPQAAPDVTVVTVCFNPLKAGREELLRKNLHSVQQQTGVLVEHLIIDGASTDGTLELISKYQNTNYDIRLLSLPDNGIYDAMNRGIALAKGKYVTFLNSDDYYHRNDGLALSVKALEQSGCTFSFAPIKPEGPAFLHRLHRHPERHLHRILIFPTIPHQSMLYSRTALIKTDGYDASYRMGGDHELTLRLIAEGNRGCFVNTPFVTFASGGYSTQDAALKLQEKVRRVRRFHEEVFHIQFTDAEIEALVRHYRYPRRYLHIYVASQKLIDRTFFGIPQSLSQRLLHGFNYAKYFLKCVLGI